MYEWEQRVKNWCDARRANAMKVGDLLDFINDEISKGTIDRDTPLCVSGAYAAEAFIEDDELCIDNEYD